MERMLRLCSYLIVLCVAGCAHWEPVAYVANPSSVADPPGAVKSLLNTRAWMLPVTVEVTGDYVKEVFATVGGPGLAPSVLPFSRVAELRIITSGGKYALVAVDKAGTLFWNYTPSGQDLDSCRKMVDSLSAVMKHAAQ